MSNSSKIKWTRTDFRLESTLKVPVLGEAVDVSVQHETAVGADSPSPAQLGALEAFLALSPITKDEWTHPVALDCHYACLRFEIDGEKPPVDLRKRSDVWNHVRLNGMTVPKHGKTKDRYIFVSGNCDWEEEHGVELLFKNERLLKVGQNSGLAQNEEWFLYFINE